MSNVDLNTQDTLSENDKLWLEEILRETEHYYQGEKQQEERSSWLLGTASALMAIIVGTYSLITEKNTDDQELLLFMAIVSFFISAVIAIFGIIPHQGTSRLILYFSQKSTIHKKPVNIFIDTIFHKDDSWSIESLKKRIFFHFRNHYVRNYEKSLFVILSAMFLFFGLLTSLVIAYRIIAPFS